ncbi:MAG: hypothetical protein FWB93_03840 [Oscillospiraceae bacterium]|nr:hypothetical protein [Oscillospiraceae bacterium]
MKRIMTLALTLTMLLFIFVACKEYEGNGQSLNRPPSYEDDETHILNNPPSQDNDESRLPTTFLNVEAFYRFAMGDRAINPDDFWLRTYLELDGWYFQLPLITAEDILGTENIEVLSVAVDRFGYDYFLEGGVQVSVMYSPGQTRRPMFEMAPTFPGITPSSFTLREGDIVIEIRIPHLPYRPPLSLEDFTEEDIVYLEEIRAEQDREILGRIANILTNPLFVPFTSVFMADTAWVETTMERWDFMTPAFVENHNAMMAEMNNSLSANDAPEILSPVDALLARIRDNMI